MQPYQNFYSQMSNYGQMMPNPYMDRMAQLQQYQQNLQQPIVPAQTPVSNQMSALGKMVDSIDVVKATDIPMDGNAYYFPKADGTEVYCKQWLQNGTTRILTFKPIENTDINNLSQTEEKLKFDLSDEATEGIMKRFDIIEKRLDDFFGKQTSKISARAKKESDVE